MFLFSFYYEVVRNCKYPKITAIFAFFQIITKHLRPSCVILYSLPASESVVGGKVCSPELYLGDRDFLIIPICIST